MSSVKVILQYLGVILAAPEALFYWSANWGVGDIMGGLGFNIASLPTLPRTNGRQP